MKLVLLVLALCIGLSASADGFVYRLFPFLKVSADSAYIGEVSKRLAVRSFSTLDAGYTSFNYNDTVSKNQYAFTLDDGGLFKVGLGASFWGFSFSYSISPAATFRHKKRSGYDYNFSVYGGRMGCDFVFSTSDRSKIRDAHNKDMYRDAVDGFSTSRFQASAYFVLRPNRFSLPAVFDQSAVQRKSAGSLIFSVMTSNTLIILNRKNAPSELDSLMNVSGMFRHFRQTMVGLSVGYGHNFVLGKWLIHISGQPSVPLYMTKRLRFADGTEAPKKSVTFSFGAKVRTAFLWQYKRHSVNMNFVLNGVTMQHGSLYANDLIFQSYLGYRFQF